MADRTVGDVTARPVTPEMAALLANIRLAFGVYPGDEVTLELDYGEVWLDRRALGRPVVYGWHPGLTT